MHLKKPAFLLVLADMTAMMMAYSGAYGVSLLLSVTIFDRSFMPSGGEIAWTWLYFIVALACLPLFSARGHYSQRAPWWEQVKYMIIMVVTITLLAGSIMFVMKLPFSRLWVLCCFVMLLPLLIIMRLVARKVALKAGTWGTDVMLIGGPENVMETVFALNSDTYNVYRVQEIHLIGTNALLDPATLPARQQGAKQVLVRSEQLSGAIKKTSCSLVAVALDESTRVDMGAILAQAQECGLDTAFVPPMSGMSLYGMDVQHFFGSHAVLLKPKRRVEKPLNRILKRALDLFGASVGLLVLGVPMIVIALMIRRDGASPFYAQPRVGYKGRMFPCWKLRSMVPNSQEVLDKLLAESEEARAEWEADFKLKNDPRITRIGHFIRKASIDELPQLWNVIKGDMSLVGPRPIVPAELDYYGKHKQDYLAAKPGLTGLWQVSGRNDTSYAYRVYLDSWYVAHWSLWTDIVIIFKTIGIVVTREGAY